MCLECGGIFGSGRRAIRQLGGSTLEGRSTISDSAGILLTNIAGAPDSMRFRFPELNVQTVVPRRGTGILMVKYGGTWMRVDPEPPPARVQPLH